MSVTLLCGDEDFNIEQALKTIRKKVLKDDFGSMNHKILKSESKREVSLKDILEVVETPGMLFGDMLIEVYSSSLFTRGKASDEKNMERLIEDLENLSPNINLVFIAIFSREKPQKIDSAKKIVKTIKKVGDIQEFYGFKHYETNKIAAWIKEHATKKKLKIDLGTATFLAEQTGFELRKLDNELEKIKTFILPREEVKKEDILKVCQNTEDVFKMTDLWLQGKKQEMLIELERLLVKNPPQMLFALIQTVSKKWLRMKLESRDKSPAEVAQIFKLHPYVVEQEIKKLRDVEIKRLVEFRQNLCEIEYAMKSGKMAADVALEMLLVK